MLKATTRIITAFVLVFILFAHNINTLVIIGDFIVNQDIIAKTLCIQKEAQKGCNGKCQLRKELTKNTQDTNNKDNPLQEGKRLALDLFCLSTICKIENTFVSSSLLKLNTSFKTPKINKMYLDIDTPPPNFS
ncbi:hypothetical protein GCM10023311_19760 [Flaviramulus aquimarinus]|uniref:Uncharacterized protein n=1 Tax=Flaviramulus aquimarinus TaxID=1170456 RepID=A0ABP9F8F2_9FLAO